MARRLVLTMAAFALAACSADAPPAAPADPARDAAREAIADYARLLIVERKAEDAFETYYADLLIQHDPWIGDGGKGDAEFLRKRREAEPEKYASLDQYVTVVHNLLTDGEFVVMKSHVFTSPGDQGREFVDIWRLEGGKFAEHWDVIRPIDEAARANVGCGVGWTYEAAKVAGDTVSKPTCGAVNAAADSAASEAAVRAAIAGEPGEVERLVADGDLVLVHRRVTTAADPRGAAHADLFRVTDGTIADRWSVIQPIPEFSASGRSMTGGPDDPLEPGRVKRAPKPGE